MKKLEIDYRRAESFGALLLQARRVRSVEEWRDVTQDDFAARVGTSAASLSRWEQGKQKPSKPVLRSIADALEVPYDLLLELWKAAVASAIEEPAQTTIRPAAPGKRIHHTTAVDKRAKRKGGSK